MQDIVPIDESVDEDSSLENDPSDKEKSLNL